MSKSGVFAHFGSREELQISVVREYHTRFEEEVFFPAVAGLRGLPRLRALFANWMKRTSIEIDSGCIYISGAVEFDDRPGPVRDALASSVKTWLAAMNRAVVLAKKEGHLRADADEQQMTLKFGLILAQTTKRFGNPGFCGSGLAGFEDVSSVSRPRCGQRPVFVFSFTVVRFIPQETAMPVYNPPLRDMQFVMHEVLKVTDEFKSMPQHADADVETINAVLEEAGKFAKEVIFPLNISGDTEGCKLDRDTHAVTTPAGFKEAYKTYVEGGWAALSCDPEFGGQGLPLVVNQCLYEMMNSANQAWTMYPGLSHGAYECLHAHGTPEQNPPTCPSWSAANGPAPCA